GFAFLLSSTLDFSQRRTLLPRNSGIDYAGFGKIRRRRLIRRLLTGSGLLLKPPLELFRLPSEFALFEVHPLALLHRSHASLLPFDEMPSYTRPAALKNVDRMETDGQYQTRQIHNAQHNGCSYLAKRTAKGSLANPLAEPAAGPLNMKCSLPSFEEPWLQLQETSPGKDEQEAPAQTFPDEKIPGCQLGNTISAEHDDPEIGSRAAAEIKI